MMVIFVTIISS